MGGNIGNYGNHHQQQQQQHYNPMMGSSRQSYGGVHSNPLPPVSSMFPPPGNYHYPSPYGIRDRGGGGAKLEVKSENVSMGSQKCGLCIK